MFLALAEIRRTRGKFILLAAAVALLVYLILVQQAISHALVTSFNGAVRNVNAPVLVYGTDALRSPQGSVIIPEWEQAILDDASVAASARLALTSVTPEGSDETVSLWGVEDWDLGGPREIADGERPAAAGEALGSAGDFEVGDEVQLADGPTLTITGTVADSQLAVQPVLFTSWADYDEAFIAMNPGAPTAVPNMVTVEPATDAATTIAALRDASADLDPLTPADAAAEFPGVAPVETSFLIILGLFGFVVPLLTGLFFLILTFQKARSLTLLRAMGSRSGVLVRSLLVQVFLVLAVGLALGTALYAATTLIEIGTLTLAFSWQSVAVWSALLLALGVASAFASVRRVLAVDPIEATKGGGH